MTIASGSSLQRTLQNYISAGTRSGTAREGVEHFGDLDGEAIPSGNHLHYSEGPDACTVDLTLFGEYIVADDNDRCGGMNVRFWGVWIRSRK